MTRLFGSLVFAMALVSLAPQARAQVITYKANLDGPSESPVNSSTATGSVQVVYNPTAHTLRLVGSFTGLGSTSTQAHIHAATTTPFTGTAGVATVTPAFPTFPIGVTSGSFDSTLDLLAAGSYNTPYVTSNGGTPATAEVALASAIASGRAYFNIHSTLIPGGEIRGFLVTAVPEPGSMALTGLAALAGLKFLRRRGRAAEAPAVSA